MVPNKSGVFENARRHVFIKQKGIYASIRIADQDGRWCYGITYKVGGARVNSRGRGFGPSFKWNEYTSEKACMMAAKKELRGIIQEQIDNCRRCKSWAVMRMAKKALDAVPLYEQLTLFKLKRSRNGR